MHLAATWNSDDDFQETLVALATGQELRTRLSDRWRDLRFRSSIGIWGTQRSQVDFSLLNACNIS